MRDSTVYSLGDPGTFDITDKNDPQYYIARFSHEMSRNFFNLQTAGFKFQQLETTDYSGFEDAFDTITGTIATWFDTAVGQSEAGEDIDNPPALPDLTTLLPVLLGQPWLTFLIKFGIQIVLWWVKKRLDSDTDTAEIAQILRKALLIEDPEENEYAILELLAQVPIEIILSQFGQFQEIFYSDQP